MADHKIPGDVAFFAAIGRLSIAWAMLEFALDGAISIIHQRLEGHTVEREVPIHIGRKITYLKRCFKKLQPLMPHQQIILPLLQEIQKAVEFRKNIIHGCIMAQPLEGTNEVKMIRLLHSPDGIHTEKPIMVTTTMIRTASDEAVELTIKAGQFTLALAKPLLK